MRHIYQKTAQDGTGRVIQAANITVYLDDGTTLATIYAAVSGGVAVTNSVVQSDTYGQYEFYVDDSEYMPAQKFQIVLSKTGYTSQTLENVSIIPDDPYKYYCDATATDQGAATTRADRSLKDLNDTIGSSLMAEIVLPQSGTGNTTTYTLTTSETLNSNIKLNIENGAILDGAGTLTLDSPYQIIAAPDQQIFGSSITVTFTNAGTVYPEWWGIDGTSDEVEFQAANDSLSSGGTVELAEATYVFKAPNTITILATKYYGVKPSSSVNWIGKGYNSVIKMDDSQTAGGNDPALFATNVAYQNVAFEGIRFDLNGANNDIASSLNTPALYIGGDSAYVKNVQVRNCWFENCPGLNFIIFGQSNSTGATLGDNITISSNKFYQGGIDASINDHTSVYTWANNFKLIDNYFENESSNTTGWTYGTAWEFHGSNCVATGNIVKRYARGCYAGINYVADSDRQIINGNSFELITKEGINVWIGGADGKNLTDINISNNNINITDQNIASGYGVRITPSAATAGDLGMVIISDNHFTKTGGTDQLKMGVYIEPASGLTIDDVAVIGNTFDGFVMGVHASSTSQAIKKVAVSNNRFFNNEDAAGSSAIGVYTEGANGITDLTVSNNQFIDNQAIPTFKYGIYLSGTVTNVMVDGNYYRALTENNYLESSLTYTTKKIDGFWICDVDAAATGGTDTFIITVTFDANTTNAGFITDVVGNFLATEAIYKQFAHTCYLASDSISDAESAEVITIGDALKSQLTAGNPAAVGSGNQITVTYTNADNTAFTGVLSLRGITDALEQIISVTVSNNQ